MADFTDDQLQRALDPDGWRPRIIPCEDGEEFTPEVKAMLAALDDETPVDPPAVEAEPPRATLSNASKAAANAAMLKAAREARLQRDIERRRREEDAILAGKLERKCAAARERQRRKRLKDRAASYSSVDDMLLDLRTEEPGIPVPYRAPVGAARQFDKRMAALRTATAHHNGDQFLIQLQRREFEYAVAWATRELVRKRCDGKVTARNMAKHHPDKSMTKRRAERLLEKLAKLEQPGRPWHGM